MSPLASAGSSEAISPTAHYTGYVWARNGLSHRRLASRRGRIFFQALRPAMTLSGALGGPTLESYLLARHRALDALLEQAIEQGGVRQVIELACGLSPRGWRFAARYGEELTYVEADLPEMAERKRRALADLGTLGSHHRVEPVDALRERGPESVAALAGRLDPGGGLAILTEGLVGYLQREELERMWALLARELRRFAAGWYISDLHVAGDGGMPVQAFRSALGLFVRRPVALHHYTDAAEAERALVRAGFASARAQRAADLAPPERAPGAGARLARVVHAQTGGADEDAAG
jgi:O-methyltransferase involved in polyketide biosynthesis